MCCDLSEFYFSVLCCLQPKVTLGLIMLPSDIVIGDILRQYGVGYICDYLLG